mmetsp:Transcript_6240/g.20666  ORF Transcript_6240/g.20666 Transcript_6240/m.20666 type:complete len:220 (-) Transcript_6240:75-734(-)
MSIAPLVQTSLRAAYSRMHFGRSRAGCGGFAHARGGCQQSGGRGVLHRPRANLPRARCGRRSRRQGGAPGRDCPRLPDAGGDRDRDRPHERRSCLHAHPGALGVGARVCGLASVQRCGAEGEWRDARDAGRGRRAHRLSAAAALRNGRRRRKGPPLQGAVLDRPLPPSRGHFQAGLPARRGADGMASGALRLGGGARRTARRRWHAARWQRRGALRGRG